MEPLVHFALPLAALLMLGVELKTAAPLALLGILPDMDALLLIHRSFSHSFVVLGLLFLVILLITERFRFAPPKFVALAFLVVASHIVLDLGSLTPILWPIYPYDVSLKIAINLVLGNGVGLTPSFKLTETPTEFIKVTGIDYPLFTEEGLLLTVVLLIPVLYNLARIKNVKA